MALTIEATFENGVFVPKQRPELAEHQRVRLVIESVAPAPADEHVVIRRRSQRIQLDPRLAIDIASSAEFLPEEKW